MQTGFEILINDVPRTFRDRQDMTYEAARFLKSKNPTAIVSYSTATNTPRLELRPQA